jgi:hypothetical protein
MSLISRLILMIKEIEDEASARVFAGILPGPAPRFCAHSARGEMKPVHEGPLGYLKPCDQNERRSSDSVQVILL